MVGGTPEFPGQLIASLFVAQWSERWCTSLVTQGSIPGMSRSESAITRGKTQMMLLPSTSFSWTTSYVLTCLQDSWPEIAIKGFEPGTFESVFWSKATEGQWLEVPRQSFQKLVSSVSWILRNIFKNCRDLGTFWTNINMFLIYSIYDIFSLCNS